MAILFILALILAWPTMGLSLVFWLVLAYFGAKKKSQGMDRMREVRFVVRPFFPESLADFYLALDVPHFPLMEPDRDTAEKCGSHIVNYISHNPTETARFVAAMELWRRKRHGAEIGALQAVEMEHERGGFQPVRLLGLQAVDAVMDNNSLSCFSGVVHAGLKAEIARIELFQELRSALRGT